MQVAILTLTLRLDWCRSLKDKRQEIKGLIDTIIRQFHVSAAESEYQDNHNLSEVTIAFLVFHRAQADKIADSVVQYVENHSQGELTDIFLELR
ncbi:MAG: DUF503 domain-containing protein [Oscillospiraceae bacterium]